MDFFNMDQNKIDQLVNGGYLQPQTADAIKKNQFNMYAQNPQLAQEPIRTVAQTQPDQSQTKATIPAVDGSQKNPFTYIDEMQKNYLAGGMIGAQKAGEEIGYYNTLSKELDNIETERKEAALRQQSTLDDYMKELNTTISDVKNQKLDSSRLMNQSTGNKILSALAIGLGTVGAALTKTPNYTLQIINDAINRDIEDQRYELSKTGKILDLKTSIYKTMLAKYQDENAARNAAKAAMLEKAQVDLNRVSAKYTSATAQNQAKMIYDQLEGQKQQAVADFYKTVAVKSQIGKPGFDFNNLPKDDRERYVPGFGLAPTKEKAADFSQGLKDTQDAKAIITELYEMGRALPGSEQKARAETLMTTLGGKLRLPLLGPGTMTKEEFARLVTAIGNPTDIWQLNNKAKLETLYKTLDDSMNSWAKNLGLKSTTATPVK